MLQVTLGEKVYRVNYAKAIVLRALEEPMKILERPDSGSLEEACARDLDALVNWFCLLFENQFTASDVYEFYPTDRLLHDIAIAVYAVKSHVSQALPPFPIYQEESASDGLKPETAPAVMEMKAN